MTRAHNIVGWTGDTAAVPGSQRRECTKCGDTVWLAPSGQKLEANGATVLCLQCCLVTYDPEHVEVRLAPGALAEFLKIRTDPKL